MTYFVLSLTWTVNTVVVCRRCMRRWSLSCETSCSVCCQQLPTQTLRHELTHSICQPPCWSAVHFFVVVCVLFSVSNQYGVTTVIFKRLSIAEIDGCLSPNLFVCLWTCLFANTITSERLNVGWWKLVSRCIVQKSYPSWNFRVIGLIFGGSSPPKCGKSIISHSVNQAKAACQTVHK